MLQGEVLVILEEGPRTRKELVRLLRNEDLLDKALHRLLEANLVGRPKRGVYALPSPN